MTTPALEGMTLQPRFTQASGRGWQTARLLDVIRNWYDETHSELWGSCQQQPCYAVQRVTLY